VRSGSGAVFLVDTSVWIFALSRRGQAAIRRRIDELLENDQVATCGLVTLELLGGSARREEVDRLRRRLTGVRYVDTLEVDWQRGAEIASQLRRAQRTVPPTDALLAAVAKRIDAVLLHADADFETIASHVELRTESLVDQVGAST
jgi:predicted nucleic acid-binding protein